jgi:hypothetical protein
MMMRKGAALGAALFVSLGLFAQAHAAPGVMAPHAAPHHSTLARAPLTPADPRLSRPWDEGVTPPLENRLFDATYKALPNHNVLKVYVFDTAGFESAGIRFSARVAHEPRDLSATELDHEAVALIRTTFDQFPQLQTLDIWATIPVPAAEMTELESTVFSVSADRATYESIRDDTTRSDDAFLAAFGQVWVGPEIQP